MGIKEYIIWYKKKKKIWDDPKHRFNEFPWLAFFACVIEVLLCSISMLDGKPEFIFIWLGVKTAFEVISGNVTQLNPVLERLFVL